MRSVMYCSAKTRASRISIFIDITFLCTGVNLITASPTSISDRSWAAFFRTDDQPPLAESSGYQILYQGFLSLDDSGTAWN